MPDPSSVFVPPTPGVVLGGRFRVEEALGSGGMADVFRATELVSGRSVAVKVLRASPEQSPEATARLRREGQVLRALKNPAIVGIDEVTEIDGGRVMLVMELLRGETLGARMRRGRLEPLELAPIVAGTTAGLSAAHANGVVHRDLKPDNIFLANGSDGRVQVKLLDFGVSKVFGGERLTQTGQVLGTPRYMSPEQLGAEPEVDHRVDIYSLGVILYEALTGKPPFLASTPTDLIVAILHGKITPLRSLRPDLPASMEAVVMRAMARVRDARFRAATELADAFFEAAGVAPGAVAKPRAGMATTPLGSLRTLDPALQAAPAPAAVPAKPPPAASPSQRDSLTPGTFSAMPAFDEAEVRARAAAESSPHLTAPARPHNVALAATALAPPGASPAAPPSAVLTGPAVEAAPRAREIPRTQLSVMEQPVPAVVAASVAMAPGHAVPPPMSAGAPYAGSMQGGAAAHAPPGASMTGPRPASPELLEPSVAPPRTGRWVLALVGLGAGAVTAAIIVGVLGFLGLLPGTSVAAPPPPPPSFPAAADASAPDDAGADAAIEPDAGVEPDAATPTSSGHHRGGHHAAHDGTPPPSSTTGDPDPQTTDPLGAAADCVTAMSGLITGGGTPIALRRRADCLMRMGRTEEAIADYQRFCRLAPDHPSIPEVRERLEGMGRTCP
ncbi:MAG: protein kinase [Sandaracinus sp.]